MIIKIIFIIWIAIQIIGGIIVAVTQHVKYKRQEQAEIEFANKPKEELLAIALRQPNLEAMYYTFGRSMPYDTAADLVINKMLIDLRIIGYRKDEEEL